MTVEPAGGAVAIATPFDEHEAVREQAADVGIVYDSGPKF